MKIQYLYKGAGIIEHLHKPAESHRHRHAHPHALPHTFSKSTLNPYQLGSDNRCLIHPLLTVKQSTVQFVPCLVQSPKTDVMPEECSWVRVCRMLEQWCWSTDLKQYGHVFVYNSKFSFRGWMLACWRYIGDQTARNICQWQERKHWHFQEDTQTSNRWWPGKKKYKCTHEPTQRHRISQSKSYNSVSLSHSLLIQYNLMG